MPERLGQQLGNYRLLRLLGRGGFAEVYLGEHLFLKRRAALKVLHTSLEEEEVDQFLAEAQTLARLEHPNIVRVHDFAVEQDGTPFLVMDYAPRGTLLQYHPRGSCLSLETTVTYVKYVAAALQYAHNHHVIHRDVKPGNMLLGLQQQVMLSDFGIALLSPSPEQLSTQGREGTIPYMAPEQLRGKPGFASDQYALGIVVYEWLCGARPFEGEPWQIAYQQVSVPPPRLREKDSSLPEAVEEVVLKALAKEPKDRYVSVQMFAQALEKACALSPLDVHSDGQVTTPLDRIAPAVPITPPVSPRRVFLSASPSDDALVVRFEANLQQHGIAVLHEDPDTMQDSPGLEDVERQAIRAVDIVLVVLSPNSRSSRTIKEHLRIANLYQRRLVFVWVAGQEIVDVLPQTQQWGRTAQVDLIDARGERYEQALAEIVISLEGDQTPLVETALPEPEFEPRNPYKGLRAFAKNDAADFFGRESLIEELVDRVKGIPLPERPGVPMARLLAVIGASGSGKSSVVMAGLLPRLERGVLPGSEQWVYLEPVVPGAHPLEALALTLALRLSGGSVKSILEDLEDESARGLHLLATRLVRAPGQQVVLFIDQFEELFTLTTSEEERSHFIDLLVTAMTEPRGPLCVLLTLRADFYDRPIAYPALHQLIETHQKTVLPMTLADLRAVIKGPAALPDVQLIFEGSLVGDLLFEVGGQVGALPLLQFTLEQLFERHKGHTLTMQAYREIGGVRGALAKHAEDAYTALPSEEHRKLARALFLRLIDSGITHQDATRRRAILSELALPAAKETELLQQVTASFLDARLLTTNEMAGTPTIEVSHEALIREWTRLSDWLREAREDIRLQQTISGDVAEWQRHGKPGDRLYRGSQLKEARAWARRSTPSGNEMAFLRASAANRVRFVVSVLAVLLLVVSSIGIASWFLTHPAPDPTHVTNLQDHGPGSLRQAIDESPAGSTIMFDEHQSGTIMLVSQLNIAKNLTIQGPMAHTVSVSSGTSGHRVHVLKGFSVIITNLIFKDSIIRLNSFIYNEGTLSLLNSTVSGNRADFSNGGGIYNGGTLTLVNSTVSGNRADFSGGNDGGGIYNGGTLTLVNSTVSGNRADFGGGGGIYSEGTLTLVNSTVANNSAVSTGGIHNRFEDKLFLINSTVANQSAS
jgi:serine/threonine protein kinase